MVWLSCARVSIGGRLLAFQEATWSINICLKYSHVNKYIASAEKMIWGKVRSIRKVLWSMAMWWDSGGVKRTMHSANHVRC